MNERTPDFDELVGDDLSAVERARLLHVHELLVKAGPPVPTSGVEDPPAPPAAVVVPFRRRPRIRLAAIAAVAAVVMIGFGAGYLVGNRGPDPVRVVAMRGADASASLAVFAKDDAGNWPMELKVTGLPAGPTYALWLTRKGRLADPCGTFAVGPGETRVPLNAPYALKEYDGWVVVRAGQTTPLLTTQL